MADEPVSRNLNTAVPRRDHRVIGVVSLVSVLLLGGILRFYHLDGYGLWSDEFVTLLIVSKTSWLELIRTCFNVPQPMPPLYFMAERPFVALFGANEISLRLLSALSSWLLLYFVFAIGRMLFDFEVGLVAALLCAVNSTQIVYAQNARPYAFCLLLASISFLSFLKWMKSQTRLSGSTFILSTALLLYSHYVFFLVPLIQNLYFLWLRRSQIPYCDQPASAGRWRSWVRLQSCVGILLLPLAHQLWAILRSRQMLNWASGLAQYYPRFDGFFFFLKPQLVFLSLAVSLSASGLGLYLKGVLRRPGQDGDAAHSQRNPASSRFGSELPPCASLRSDGVVASSRGSFVFLMLWYLVPLILFFGLARMNLVHLFVERYLILASLASYLLISSIALRLFPVCASRILVIAYLVIYIIAEPGTYFFQKRQFSQGVPGGNEWRETLAELSDPAFNVSLFLFQSPFIESNQLHFTSKPDLLEYLAAPLRSFYVRDKHPFVLLPVHWWVDGNAHREFKAQIKELIVSHREFTLLSTEEFWSYFSPWMANQLSAGYQINQVRTFRSSGSLGLRTIKLSSVPAAN
jgi:4-amino-4-deoxy-L-arabinose transferase-like glycosyltransferase